MADSPASPLPARVIIRGRVNSRHFRIRCRSTPTAAVLPRQFEAVSYRRLAAWGSLLPLVEFLTETTRGFLKCLHVLSPSSHRPVLVPLNHNGTGRADEREKNSNIWGKYSGF